MTAEAHIFRQPRKEDKKHLDFIRSLPCIICGIGAPNQAAHIRYASPEAGKRATGMAEKPGDRWTVPLCPRCHTDGPEAQHRAGEAAWWLKRAVDPIAAAKSLYEASGDQAKGNMIVLEFYCHLF